MTGCLPPPRAEVVSMGTATPWRRAATRATTAWPAKGQAAAIARLEAGGLPDRRTEDWRYTDLAPFLERWNRYLDASVAPGSRGPEAAPELPATGALRVDIRDGQPVAPAGALPGGLSISVRPAGPDLLARADAVESEPLVDLNTALATGVVVITLAPGVALDDAPVHVRLIGTGAPLLAQPRLLVDLGAGSRLALTVEHTGGPAALVNAVTQAWVGPGGHLELVRAQCLPDDGMLMDTGRIELAAGASATVTSVDLGGLLARQSLALVLAGAGASARVDGLFLADGNRHLDSRTRIEHRAAATTSREDFRGLADGHGHGVFNGRIIVLPGAAGSSAELTNRNLLLAATAEIDTKPELETYVDDVRCSHGATTGQLDPQALFYLRSRGLEPGAARLALTRAFLGRTLAGIRNPTLRTHLEAQLEVRLGRSGPP